MTMRSFFDLLILEIQKPCVFFLPKNTVFLIHDILEHPFFPSASASAHSCMDGFAGFILGNKHIILYSAKISWVFLRPPSACFSRRFWERVAQQQKQLVTRVFIGLQGLNNLFRFSDPFGSRLLFLANSMRKVPGDFVWDTDGLPFQWLPPELKNPQVEDTQTLTAQIHKSPSKPAFFCQKWSFRTFKGGKCDRFLEGTLPATV